MNKQLAEKVKRLISKHHEHFSMGTWLDGFYNDDAVDIEAMEQGCGTTGCLAAWVCIAAGERLAGSEMVDGEPIMRVEAKAQQLLEVSGNGVFYADRWPSALCDQYYDARDDDDTLGMAMAACEALDYFGEG